MEQTMQSQQPNMTPDESAAALSFATMLSEGMMPKAPQDASQTPETAPGGEETPETGNMPMEEETLDLEAEPEEDGHMKEMESKMEKMMDEKMTKMEARMEKTMKDMVGDKEKSNEQQ